MSDSKTSDKDLQDRALEPQALRAPDAQDARTAGASDLAAVEKSRTNASDGSLRKYGGIDLATQEQSIEIDFGDRLVSRKSALTEKDIAKPVHLSDRASLRVGGIADGINPNLPAFKGRVEESAITDQGLFEMIAKLPLDQQAKVLGSGVQAFSQEWDWQKYRIMVGTISGIGDGIVGLAQGAESLSKAVCDVAQFSKEIMLNDPAAIDKSGTAGEAIGKLLVGGIRLWQVTDTYLGSIGAAGGAGDYTKAFRDISWLGRQINQRWQAMDPEEKARLSTKLATENLGGLAVGFGVSKLAKSVKITEALEELGVAASECGAGTREKSTI